MAGSAARADDRLVADVVDERWTGGFDEQLLVKTTAATARHSPALSESDFLLAADRGDVPARFTQGQYWSCRPDTIGPRNRPVLKCPGLIPIYSS
jgi:hypothetical protein